MRRTPGFMSYTKDPSLRRHMSGPIEPLDYSRPRLWPRLVVALVVAVITVIYLRA